MNVTACLSFYCNAFSSPHVVVNFTSSVRHHLSDGSGVGLHFTVYGNILNLVVVDDIGLRRCIDMRVSRTLTRRALTCDQFRVNLLVFTVSFFTPQDIESSVVQFRFGDPNDADRTVVKPYRTELRQAHGQRTTSTETRCTDSHLDRRNRFRKSQKRDSFRPPRPMLLPLYP